MSNNVVDIVVQLTDKNTQAGLERIAATSKGTVAELSKLKTEMMAIGAGVGIVGLGKKLADEALQWNTQVRTMQRLTGATAEQVSSLMAVADYMGVSAETSTTSFAKFSKALAGARDSMQSAAEQGSASSDAFSKLGLTLNDIQGKNTVEVFQLIQDRLRGMKDGAEKTRIEMELFGKSGYQLNGMLNMSAEAMKQVEDRARAMGLVIDDEAAQQSANFNRQLKDMEATGRRLAITIGQELLPVIMDYAQGAIDLAREYSSLAVEQKEAIAGVIKFAIEAGTAVTVIRTATSALGFMRLATLAAAGPWLALAAAIGIATKSVYNYIYARKTAGSDTGVTTAGGLKAHINTNEPTHNLSDAYMAKHDARYWVEDSSFFGLFKNDRLATKEEGAEIEAALQAKSQAEAEKKKADERQAALDKEIEDAKNGGGATGAALSGASKSLNDAAQAQEKAAQEQKQASERMSQAVERLTDMLRTLTMQSLELDGSQYDIDKANAKNQFDSNNRNLINIIKSAMQTGGIGGGSGSASSVLDAANAQLGKPYLLGADGTWATDCGKLFADSVKAAFGKDVPRVVPDIMNAARAAGAWHDAGDGYVPKAGDGVVVLGDNHIVIADGNGGYTGANSHGPNGGPGQVLSKPSVENDFGTPTGYVDTAVLVGAPATGATPGKVSAQGLANAKALAGSGLVAEIKAKNEEVYQKRLVEAERNQKIRVRKMNEDIAKLDLERTGDRLQLIKEESEAQKAQIDDNIKDYTKAVGDKALAEKKANAEKLKLAADTEQKIRELAYTQTSEATDHQANLVKLGHFTQEQSDAILGEQLQSYIDYAKNELATAQMTATQRLQIEKNLVDAQQKLWEMAGRNLKTRLQEGARQYQQETVNYAEQAKSTFDSTMSSINSTWTSNLEAMATGTKSFSKGLISIFKDMTNSIIKMMVNLSFQQYLQPKLQSLFGGVAGGIGAIGVGHHSFSTGRSFSSAFSSGGFKKFASGGVAPTGMTLVGENGPELLQFNASHRIYNASQTRKMLGGNQGNNVTVNIINQSGQSLESEQQSSRFDGENYIIDVVVKAVTNNKGGARDAIKAAAG